MSYRETTLTEGEIYHIYNRGVEKRIIFEDKEDYDRFLNNLRILNTEDVIGSVFEFNRNGLETPKQEERLVNIIAYSLSPNHYHLILEQIKEGGIAKFIHKVTMGYSKYFNHKHKRVGTLFQGVFKSIHINTNEYLLYLSAYVNLNNKIHSNKIGLEYSSWREYSSQTELGYKNLCSNDIILSQYKNRADYKKYALELLPELTRQKIEKKELKGKELQFRKFALEI
jgi:putative transposase